MNSAELPWVEKYRPTDLSEMIDHQEKIVTIRKLIQNKELPHLLLYGVPGSGKTSLILAAAREMYGPGFRQYVLELNASDRRGIDIVRNTIPEFVKVKSAKLRLVILDEVDAMTGDAQRALRKVMEKYIKNSRFCLICNNITQILPGVQSRCIPMRFGVLQSTEIQKKLRTIIAAEKVRIEDSAIETIIEINRDFRRILNSLQQIHYIKLGVSESSEYPTITSHDVYHYEGVPSKEQVNEIYQLLFQDFTKSYEKLTSLFLQNEWNLLSLIEKISEKIMSDDMIGDNQRYYLLKRMSKIEYRVVNGRESEIQLASLLADFQMSKRKADEDNGSDSESDID